jgi:hypothetical protein
MPVQKMRVRVRLSRVGAESTTARTLANSTEWKGTGGAA